MNEFDDSSFQSKTPSMQPGNIWTKNFVGKYHCDVCSYTSNYLSNLKRHYMIHTGQCPYTCNICGRSFNQRDSLKRHFKVHRHLTKYKDKVRMNILPFEKQE